MSLPRRNFIRASAGTVVAGSLLAGCLGGGGSGTGSDGSTGAESTPTEMPAEPVTVRIQAGAPGTSFYAISAPLGDILSRNTNNPPIEPTVSTSGGSVSNVRLLLDGETEIATAVASVVHSAYHGNDPFEQAHQNVRCLMRGELFPQFYVVRNNSDIQNIMDLPGHRVSAGPAGSGQLATHQGLMELFGLEDINLQQLTHAEGGRALKDGEIDAWFIFLAADVQNAFQTSNLRVVPFTEEQVTTIRDEWPWVGRTELTPDRLGGMRQDSALVIGGNSIWTVLDDMDDQVAFEITRAAVEGAEQIRQNNPENSANFGAEFANFDFGVPYHEGAIRYYEGA